MSVTPGLSISFTKIRQDTLTTTSGYRGDTTSALVTALGSNYSNGTDPFTGEKGLAICEIDTTNGYWQQSINGSTWTQITDITETNYLIMKNNTGYYIRFIPNQNFSGTTFIKFRGFNTTGYGNTPFLLNTAEMVFSAEAVTATLLVASKIPVLLNSPTNTLTFTTSTPVEDDTSTRTTNSTELTTNIGANYSIDSLYTSYRGIAIYEVTPGAGTFRMSSTNKDFDTTLNGSNACLLKFSDFIGFTYSVRANFNGTVTIKYRLWNTIDGQATGAFVNIPQVGSPTQFSEGTGTLTFSVAPSNDAPVMTSATYVGSAKYYTLPNLYSPNGPSIHYLQNILSNYTITDVDGTTLANMGIVITKINDTITTPICVWSYSLDNQQTWTNIATTTSGLTNNEVHLPITAYIKITPNSIKSSGSTGAAGSTNIQFRAWDMTNSASLVNNKTNISTVGNGGSTPYSLDVSNIKLNIVGGPPSITSKTIIVGTFLEDTPDVSITLDVYDIINTDIGSQYIKSNSIDPKGIYISLTNPGTYFDIVEYTRDGGNTWIPAPTNIYFTESSQNKLRMRSLKANKNGTASFSIKAWDTYVESSTSTLNVTASSVSANTLFYNINITSVNDTPFISGSYEMTPVDWSTTNTDVTEEVSISTLLSTFTITGEVDQLSSNNINESNLVIVGADTTYGKWEYSINNKVSWTELSNVSPQTGVHFRKGSATTSWIRYTGKAYAGQSSVTVRAWDNTNTPSLSNGAIADASITGPPTPYSNSTATITKTINMIGPQPPSNLTGTSLESVGISLSWTASSNFGGAQSVTYTIYKQNPDSSYTSIATTTDTTKTIIGIDAGQTHIFYVTATNNIESAPCDPVGVLYQSRPALYNSPSVTLHPAVQLAENDLGTTIEYIINELGVNYIPALQSELRGIALTSVQNIDGTWQFITPYSDGWQTIPDTVSSSVPLLLIDSSIRFVPDPAFTGGAPPITFIAWNVNEGDVGEVYPIPEGSMNFSNSSGTLNLTVTGVEVPNTAPILSGDGINMPNWLPNTEPYATSDILTNYTISDSEQTDYGIAIYQADTNLGVWEYSIDNKATWSQMAALSATNAIHLNINASTFVRFVNQTPHGSGQTGFQFYAWDKTNIGSLTDVYGNTQGSTAYSSDSKSFNVNVYSLPSNPVNVTGFANYGGNCVTIQWGASTQDGGSPIYEYRIYLLDSNSQVVSQIYNGNDYGINYGNSITWGETYRFKIQAVNNIGESVNTETIVIPYGVAPQLVNSPTVVLDGIERNITSYDGHTIQSILDGLGENYQDSTGSEKAIAISSFSNLNGTWQYKNDDINWTNIPTLSTNQVFLLSTYNNQVIRFISKVNYEGTETITIRAWNIRMYGNTEIQTYSSGSHFSSETATLSLTISGGVYINDAPVVSGAITPLTIYSNLTSTPNTPIPISRLFTGLTITDTGDSNAQTNSGLAITNLANTASGTWQIIRNGVASTITAGNYTTNAYHFYRTEDEYIKFVPTNSASNGTTTIKLRIWDKSNQSTINLDANKRGSTSTTGGSSPYSSLELTFNITILGGPVSPPTITSPTQTTTSLTLGWGAYTTANLNGGTLSGYNIYSVTGSVYTLLGSTDASTRSFTVTSNLLNKTDYTYAITGITNYGEGTYGTIAVHFVGVLPVATQPQLNNTPVLLFPSIQMNVSNPSGISVSEIITLLGSNYVKGSPTDEDGISISARGGNGAWQYSTDNGTSWTSMPGLSTASQLLLSAVPTGSLTNKVRFIPNANFTATSSITIRAWNPLAGVTGLPGTTFTRATYFGYSSFFSAGTASASFPINTAPVASQVSLNNTPTVILPSIIEDAISPSGISIASIITLLGVNYVKGSVSDETGIAIYSAETLNGSWQYSLNNGTSWSVIPTVSLSSHFLLSATPTGASTQLVRFVPTANYNGSTSISFRAWNPVSGGVGTAGQSFTYAASVYFSTGTASATITVTGQNDAPTLTGTYIFNELVIPGTHQPVALDTILNSYTLGDVDISNAQGCAIVAADATIGTWMYSLDNKVTWNDLSTVSTTSAVHLARAPTTFIKFFPQGTNIGTTSLELKAWDGTNGISNGGYGNASIGGTTTAYSSSTSILTMSVSTVPSKPQNISASANSQTATAALSWQAPNNAGGKSITSYKIYRIVNSLPVLETTVNALNLTLTTGFTPGNTYSFQIRAVNGNGEGEVTDTITTTFESLIVPEPPTQILPISKFQSIQLSWAAPINANILPITSYKIYDALTSSLIHESSVTMVTISAINFRVYKLYIEAIASDTKKSTSQGYIYAYPYTIATNRETEVESMITQYGTHPDILIEILESIAREFTPTSYQMIKCILKAYLQLRGPTGTTKQKSDFLFAFVKRCYDGERGDDEVCRELFKAATEVLQNITIANTVATHELKQDRILDVRNNTKQILDAAKELSVNSSLKSLVRSSTIELTVNTPEIVNSEIVKSEIIISVLGVTYMDDNTKKDIVPVLQAAMPNASISLSPQEVTTFKQMVPLEKTTIEFQEATDITIKIPPPTRIINLSTETSGKPVFITLEPDVNYKAIFLSANKSLVYSAGGISVLGDAAGLGSIITIGTGRFKVIQVGSLTLQYLPTEDESNSGIVYPPHKAYDASDVTAYRRDCTQYTFVKEIEDANPGYKYQYKSHTERLQAKIGKITTPQAIAMRRNGGPPCS